MNNDQLIKRIDSILTKKPVIGRNGFESPLDKARKVVFLEAVNRSIQGYADEMPEDFKGNSLYKRFADQYIRGQNHRFAIQAIRENRNILNMSDFNTLLLSALHSAVEEGRAAFMQGFSKKDNPYTYSQHHADWNNGYNFEKNNYAHKNLCMSA